MKEKPLLIDGFGESVPGVKNLRSFVFRIFCLTPEAIQQAVDMEATTFLGVKIMKNLLVKNMSARKNIVLILINGVQVSR